MLASAGLLRGRRLTSWPGLRDDLVNAGATWLDEPPTRLTYEIRESQGGVSSLTVTHELDGAPQTAAQTANDGDRDES